jgi:hypothetical protein
MYTVYDVFTSPFPTRQRGHITTVEATRLRLNKKPENNTINKTPIRESLLIQYNKREHDQRAYHRKSKGASTLLVLVLV